MRVGTAAAVGYLALQGGKAVWALRTARVVPGPRTPAPTETARVVVAQPILSGDPGLEDALRDNLLALDGVRFVWLVDEDDPEGRAVAERLAAQAARSGPVRSGPAGAPRIDVVVCPVTPEGTNPKLAKLQVALDGCADDDVLLALDDDTRLPAASLGALLDGLERATIATGLPGYLRGATPWAALVDQFVDANAATTYLTLPPVTINGMTWAMRAGELRSLGGFAPIARALTDDLALARLVLGSGGSICQTAAPQWITTTVDGPRHYVALMHRWMLFATLLLRRQPPSTAAAITVLHGLHPTLLAVVLGDAVRQRRPLTAFAVLSVRGLLLRRLQRRIHGRVLHRPVASVVAELVQPLHLVHGAVRPTIRWRTRTYRVRADDDFRDA
ncbi:ceramide glucosyltransferase [Nocardioides zeae]|uniref:Ceramide glucosyltransferase n=1 Tax=Nocardioides zeae TaxID=1457234 RepID=A0ACC6ICW6_9ACTN|nr:glycosyltransferase [Nocardioides zeae]MDR6175578.1 ceramide glucosyltransferase [Nocardioides zeae]MDR6208509.1 ceramide glucosyltransferase [Nocardioides zeae]